MKLKPKTSANLNLKKVIIYTLIGGSILSGLTYLGVTFFGVVIPKKVMAKKVEGYSCNAEITIDQSKVHGSNDLTDFTIAISVTNQNLKHVSLGGKVENKLGYDIVFSDMDGEQLNHQIEHYDPNTGEYVAWVKAPVLYANSNTELKMYYGKSNLSKDPSSEDTFNSNYEGVWHMNDDPSLSEINDSRGYHDGKMYGSMNSSNLVEGKIGKAIEFDGKNDYFAIDKKKYHKKGEIETLTVSGWVKTTFSDSTKYSKNWSMLDFDRSEYFNVYVHGNGRAAFSTKGSGIAKASSTGIDDFFAGSSGQLNDGNWHYITAVYDGTDKFLYIDGALAATKNNPHLGTKLGSGATRYGFIGDGSEASSVNGKRNNIYYEGQYDEIRFSNTVISADWIATEYENQNSPTTFSSITFSAVVLPVELTNFNVQLLDNGVGISWSTESEINNDYFTIEKSLDAVNYEIVAEVTGAGNHNGALNYSYVDDNVSNGVSYYRLKQTDFDGKFEYFPPKPVNNENGSTEGSFTLKKISPNPFSNQFTIEIESDDYSIIDLVISNISGKQEFSTPINIDEGITEYVFNEGDKLVTGIYIVTLTKKGEKPITSKIVKK